MDEETLNIARVLPRSAVNGPGERFVIWVQGCTLHCGGCWNPDTWHTRPKTLVRALDLAETILATPGVEGITLTGGEPFEQAARLIPLVEHVRAAGLSVMAFTGYELGELDERGQRALLELCDLVVSGRYRQDRRTLASPWRGSANQTVHYLTERYRPLPALESPECEIHITHDGTLTLTGFPPQALIRFNADPVKDENGPGADDCL